MKKLLICMFMMVFVVASYGIQEGDPPRCDEHDITFASHEAADEHFDTVEHGDGGTYWADQAYQLQGSQDHYDRVMGVAEEDRENEYHMIMDELGMDEEHDMGPPFFTAVGDGDDCINIDEAFGFFGQGESIEEFANGDEEDPGFNDIAESDENDSVCGDEEVNRKEHFKAIYRGFNKMNDEQDMGMGQATMANCAAWCAGIETYKYRITEDTKSDPMARYEDSSCMCSPGFVYPDN